jgi:hypothetical protein
VLFSHTTPSLSTAAEPVESAADLQEFLDIFRGMPDPRDPRGLRQSGQLVLALDGKVLRGAWLDDRQQFTLFSAMIHDLGVTVGQLGVPDGTTEVTQVKHLMDMIPDAEDGILFTIDAAIPSQPRLPPSRITQTTISS